MSTFLGKEQKRGMDTAMQGTQGWEDAGRDLRREA